jgi:cytochrome c553
MNLHRVRSNGLSAVVLATVGVATLFAQGQNGAPNPSASAPQTTLPWAYPLNTPGIQPAKDDGAAKHVPGTAVTFTLSQVRDLFNPPDWHPEDHPAMPEIVAHGRKPDVRACGYCHLPNGQGRPENASLAGLPAAYIMQQMADYRNGLRKSSEPRMGPPAAMLVIGKNANEAEVKAAADYFSSLRPKPWIRVVETNLVPKTSVAGGMLIPAESGGKEPIGHRIIEMPEDLERTELRDSSSGFVAYAPVGSIKKGEALVTSGAGGKTIRCGICHGAELKGLGNVPSIAGRSPSYIVRQLSDIQSGNRNGPWTQLMKEAVAKLTVDDMVEIAAYTSSRTP